MGAFSEILGKFNKKNSQFETMSLAGTISVNDNWTKKEIEEQKPVTNFIRNVLGKFSENMDQSETYDHVSGNIKHLRTDFKAQIIQENLENIISELHPTPAVCGFPTPVTKDFILQNESYNRSFYTGFLGELNIDSSSDLFVNLRCMQVDHEQVHLYMGCGITKDSVPESEWQESVNKSMTMKRVLDKMEK